MIIENVALWTFVKYNWPGDIKRDTAFIVGALVLATEEE